MQSLRLIIKLSASSAGVIPCFVFCSGILLETQCLITRYNGVKQGPIIIHRWNELLRNSQSEDLVFIGQTVRNGPTADLPFFEVSNCFSANLEFIFHHPKSHSTISRNPFPNGFDHFRLSNGWFSSTAFVIFEIFTAVPKSCIPFINPCTRESIVTLSLF
jgi:hypothetical protein